MDITERAAELGRKAGEAAGSWVIDGNTTDETCRRILRGIESGDPLILDAYRVPDLSGEYSGDFTEDDLAAELGIGTRAAGSATLDDAAEAYLDGASQGFWDTVEHDCRSQLRCATVGCQNVSTVRISYRYRGNPERETEDVCGECAESYGRRAVLRDFTETPLT